MEEELKNLGLNIYESKALATLFHKKLNFKQLSKEARIPFGKVYSVIKILRKKELVEETNSRPKLIYVSSVSKVISKLLKEKERKEQDLTEKVKSFAREIDTQNKKETPFFQVGTTTEDNKNIQLRSFIEAKKEVLQIINIHHKPKSNRESKTLWEKEILKATERGITFKAIYPKNIEIPKTLKTLNKKEPQKFQIKRINTNFTRCDIIDEEKVLIKLVHQDPLQFGGVLFLENKKINNNLKKIFYEMWNTKE